MNKVLIITHINNKQLPFSLFNLFSAAFNLFGAAAELAPSVDVLLIGNNLEAVSDQLSKYSIVAKVLTLDNPNYTNPLAEDLAPTIAQLSANYTNPLAEDLAPTIAQLSANYTHVLIASDSLGKDLLPRVCGILGLPQLSEVTQIIDSETFMRFMYAGNVLAKFRLTSPIKFVTIRASAFSKYVPELSDTNIATINQIEPLENNLGVKIVGIDAHSTKVDLATAKVVVSGGVSLGSKENFTNLIGKLADKLDGAIGASRDAVEAGFSPNDTQVGQTGKVVAPNIYFAIGISGAVQHIAGMKDSKLVIAINHDPQARIFEYADYAIIGDLFEVVPQLIDKL